MNTHAIAGRWKAPSIAIRGPARGTARDSPDARHARFAVGAVLVALITALWATTFVALALDRERLVTELRRSRRRIVEAEDRERRRIAQDLHDGVQARTLLHAVELRRLVGDPALPSHTRDRIAKVAGGLDDAIDELRSFVQGIMPASLIELGLIGAVEDLLDRVPLRVSLRTSGDVATRLAPDLEGVAYFVVAEGIANVLKHSAASHAAVDVRRIGARLEIAVVDDGIGGAAITPGHGLGGLEDRVVALGGALRVDSTRAGTRLAAELPCTSS